MLKTWHGYYQALYDKKHRTYMNESIYKRIANIMMNTMSHSLKADGKNTSVERKEIIEKIFIMLHTLSF